MADRKNIWLLIIFMIVFALIFFTALLGLQRNEAIFDIGIPLMLENWLIMFLSIGSIARIVYELYRN